jgi:hypothetical protein
MDCAQHLIGSSQQKKKKSLVQKVARDYALA